MKPESFSPWSVRCRGRTWQTGALWIKCWGDGSLWFFFFFFFKLTFKHFCCSVPSTSSPKALHEHFFPSQISKLAHISTFNFSNFSLPQSTCLLLFSSFPSYLFLNFRGLRSFCAYWAQKPRSVRSPSCYIRATETKKWWRAFWCSAPQAGARGADGWVEPGLRGSPKVDSYVRLSIKIKRLQMDLPCSRIRIQSTGFWARQVCSLCLVWLKDESIN